MSYDYLLNTSEVMLRLQSILKTSLELNVLHAASSADQFEETWRPHQKVSRKNVDTMALAVNNVTA